MEQKRIIKYLTVIAGTLMLGVSVEFFVIPFDILSGGVAGLAVALAPFTHMGETLTASLLVLFMFFIGWLVLGRQFAMRTALSSCLYPVFTFLLEGLRPSLDIPMELAAFYAGLLGGLGIGIVMRAGASTGGMDIPPLVLHKITGIKVSSLVLVTDALTVLLGIAGYGLSTALIGLISVFASAWAIGRVLEAGQGQQAKSVQIISDNYEAIVKEIDARLLRGATLIDAEGTYRQEKRKIILCVVSTRQYNELLSIIRRLDDKAFVITTDASDMHGEGFTYSSPNI